MANTQKFQSVALKDATLLQIGDAKMSGVVCGMNLPMFYKTNHSATLNKELRQYCSIHCLAEDLGKGLALENIQVVDVESLKFIDAKKAFYVVGSRQKGTMSETSKYAFEKLPHAKSFAKKYGGEIMGFNEALLLAKKDFTKK
ncbi:nitrous oxide reductase accessory protein NosL [bacterium]|nr:nitrous oxide reductase accessory protein NosL [bacterium]MBU1989110.1 nitrous oxide reductase accessory protein NosL [bacterium]